MDIFLIILIVVAVYFFLAFFVLRLIAPFMGFRQYRPPADLPPEVRQAIAELENKSHDQMSYLRAAHDFVIGKFTGGRMDAVRYFPKIFRKDLGKIWDAGGYAHCTTKNFVLYALLANSKYFTAGDVKVRHTFLNFVPHQYLKVKVSGRWLDADPAAASIGSYPLGKHGWLIK